MSALQSEGQTEAATHDFTEVVQTLNELRKEYFEKATLCMLEKLAGQYCLRPTDMKQREPGISAAALISWANAVDEPTHVRAYIKEGIDLDDLDARAVGTFGLLIQSGCHSPAEYIYDWAHRATPEGREFDAFLSDLTEKVDRHFV